jgi:hypothetical protein
MSFFVAVHTWKKEDFVTVAKRVIEVLADPPEGIVLCSSYVYDTGAWCVYTSELSNAEKKIEDFLKKSVPKMKTEVKPVLQFFPPSQDIYPLVHQIIEAATK